MQRSEVLLKASQESGKEAKYYHLWYGQRAGHIDPAEKVAGWNSYSHAHVQQLVEYLNKHARERRGASK